ncbi:MAG: hypothetical protein NTX66_03915 [Candidatus Falkowbacteria bacterium]|nr:hypothetical protein [Candidatus Falkowbacteria bacterium]
MKKEMSLAPLLWSLFVVILLAGCIYFGWQVNKQQKRLDALQATVTDNTNKISGVVNFINTSLAAAQKTQ